MCFPLTPRAECSSEEIHELFIDDAERTEGENQLQLINGFFQFPIEQIEPEVVAEHQSQITITTYGFANAPASFVTALAKFDELNPHYFDDGDTSVVLPSVQMEH